MTGNALRVDIRMALGDIEMNADFQAPPGLTAFFGRSGAGKTALVDAIAGLREPSDGSISVNGRTVFDAAAGIDVPPERRRMGYVFQDARLFPHLSVEANLVYGQRFVAPERRRHQLPDVAALLDLGGLLHRRPLNLSGGEKQRVAIGRALLASPDLLLMDEPLASLDAARKSEILPFIERLRDEAGIPIVYVSHAIDEVVRLADTMVIFDRGATVAAGPVEEIMSRLDLRPLTGRHEAGAVFHVTVRGHDKTFGLTELAFAGGRLQVPMIDLPLGHALRMRVRARDVSLSLTRPADSSILNILEGTVREIGDGDGPQIDILVDVGAPLIARVTRKSAALLDLKPGRRVFALVKAAAIDRHAMGLGGTRPRQTG
ncbi:MAG: molybdenum ABC transporter ATP-binding protein [Magnetovibrio sp.]|nr:molybdenum ABC transporter ATP-binding protein [Magnetovibrio sp.]